MNKGKFIVLEGIDGAGTTAVAKEMVAQTDNSIYTYEPSDNNIGKFIRTILKKEIPHPGNEAILHLFIADRLSHIKNVIQPALDNGKTVICDRYFPSTLIYQSIANENLINKSWVVTDMFKYMMDCPDSCGKLIMPNIMLYLNVDTKVAEKRRTKRPKQKEIYEENTFLVEVKKLYDTFFTSKDYNTFMVNSLYNIDAAQRFCKTTLKSIDANKPLNTVIKKCLQSCKHLL